LESDTVSNMHRLKNTLKRWEFWAGLSVVSLTFVLAIMVVLYWKNFQEFAGVSYMGMFFISIIGGATVIIPVPSLVVQFTMGAVLNPALVGAVAGLGTGIGGTLVFLFGRSGHRLFANTGFSGSTSNRLVVRWTARIMTWARHRGSLAVFFMSAVLNPIFFPMAVAIGTSRFKLWKFFVMCWAGNTVKSMIIAYLGYFGLGSILRAIGINI
jgi:membrane protein DedA with SNARE-associated domain